MMPGSSRGISISPNAHSHLLMRFSNWVPVAACNPLTTAMSEFQSNVVVCCFSGLSPMKRIKGMKRGGIRNQSK